MRFKIIVLSLLLASCGSFSVPMPSAYKMEIRQGNYVTAEMRDKLKVGMSRAQVRFVMGTPMVSDVFHANRWDYVYLLEQGGAMVEKRRVTLYFDGDNLARIDDSGMKADAIGAE